MRKISLIFIIVLMIRFIFADLIISEMCDPQANYQNDRFIEISNKGDSSVDLTSWRVVAIGNNHAIFTWNLSGTIAPGDALVCGDATTTALFDVDFADETWSTSNSTWNGESGDGAKLYDNSEALIDNAVVDANVFGDKTYVRNPDILIPNTTYTASEWTAISVIDATDATPDSHPLPNIWINEFHYGNVSTDTGEFVEIVAPADFTGLSNITLTLYNGGDSATYGSSHKLDGFTTNGNTYQGFKIYYKDISGIQNGIDGFSLDYGGIVIQFLSYEGTFTATNGPANGMTSTNINVSESDSTTPVGYSLQLLGSGTSYSDFTWSGPYLATKGTPNSDGSGNDQSLPVTLTSFTATSGNVKVTLTWTTESEVENLGFNIYKSLYFNEQFTIINDQLIPGHGNTSTRHEYQYIDRNVINGIEYWYQLEDVSYAGETEKHNIVSAIPKGRVELGMIPNDFQLFPCYPNPFNPTTNISFNIPENAHVTLRIIDLRGNLVITLIDRELQQNQYEVTWNGKDAKNRIVGNGVYFYQLTTNKGFKSTGKMVFLR